MTYELRSVIAQTHLASLGFYEGKIDGLWGPLSQDAARRWDDAEVLAAIPKPGPGAQPAKEAPTPYDLARRHIGEKEIPGVKHNPLIIRWGRMFASWFNTDETAWCSAFVNAMAAEAGYERSGKLNARSWLEVGMPVQARFARTGDVVIFWRVAKDSWEGHVGFVVSRDAEARTVRVLGGNQNDSVSIATYSESMLLGYRRLRTLDELQGKSTSIV